MCVCERERELDSESESERESLLVSESDRAICEDPSSGTSDSV